MAHKRLGADKDTEKLVRAARRAWGENSVRLTSGNHIMFYPPGSGQIVTASLTGSTSGQRKLRLTLRRFGLEAA